MVHARVIDVLLCMSNGRPERADGRVNRRAGSHTAGWTCPREGMFTPCCAFGTCSGCLATCMFTHQYYLHALGNRRRGHQALLLERSDGRVDGQTDSQTAGWTCAREGMRTLCGYLHAVGNCNRCLAMCMFAKLYYVHAFGNRRRTAGAARVGG